MSYQRIDHWESLPELSKLHDVKDPPKQLFARGTWDPSLFTDCVAIVGSRRMSTYGRHVIDTIVPALVLQKKTIISGFMYGVDQYAHHVCIENGGRTIAVLGWGIENTLEGDDKKIGTAIVNSGGLILSEWQDQKASLWTFPVRNRIVAALSSEIIVIEAALKSGSLITANLAVKLKRKLWAVPGPITSKISAGTNMLIATGAAKMWLPGEMASNPALSKSKDPILRLLENESLSSDEIARTLQIPIAQVGAQLSLFAITGDIVERSGKYSLTTVC